MAGVSQSILKKIWACAFAFTIMPLRYALLPFISSSLQTLAANPSPSYYLVFRFHLRGYW